MEDKMESEHSYSGESSSSTDSSSGSSEGDDELLEQVRLLGHTLELPQDLCEDYAIFKEFFSMRTWEALEDEHKGHLKQFLPTFPRNDEEEKEKTVRMLFDFEPLHFTSPFDDFYSNLRQGNYRPDIDNMRIFLKKSRSKQLMRKRKLYYAKLLPELVLSRERLLAVALAAPPGPLPYIPQLQPKPSSKGHFKPVAERVKQRYFEELSAIKSEVGGIGSDDDIFPEGPPELTNKKRRNIAVAQNVDSNVSGTLGGSDSSHPTSLECLKYVLRAHRARRQYRQNHPELNTSGITLDDIKQRVALVNGAKKLMFGGPKAETQLQRMRRAPKKEKQVKEGKAGGKKKEEQQDSVENKPLLPNIKIKCEREESDSESSSFVDPVTSPKQTKKLLEHSEIKEEIIDHRYPSLSNVNYNDPILETAIKQEPQDSMSGKVIQAVPIKLEDLDGIDMMALPVEIADDSGEVAEPADEDEPLLDPDEALTETTHASFLSLVRALFPARAAHRAAKAQLRARCQAVLKSPIAPLNTWYNLSDDWCAELDSALDFLAGERGPHPDDFVPYLQFIPETKMYQWIGAGRDGDATLGRLCERWLRAASPHPPPLDPPPPKYPTTWVVRPPTSAEIAEFRAQERRRFATAAKPFTYILNGYRSIVGPCARATISCTGHGALLAPERPRHASLPALVRDAVARLPNGEGTRRDVLTLLRMSQWVAQCSEQALLGAVSSTLDRLSSAKRDPMVKFDQRSAIWTYLHRHRSEDDWMKTSSGRGRGGKVAPVQAPTPAQATPPAQAPPPAPAPPPPPPAALAPPPPPAPRVQPQTSPFIMEMEVASVEEVVDNGSDTDVDVDDSGSPGAVPHLSSAQLLMQATRATPRPANPPAKPKGKLIAVPPKHKNTPTKANLMAQAAKQASLMTQSAKQAIAAKQTLMAQVAKQSSMVTQASKQTNLAAQSAKQAPPPSTKQTNPPAPAKTMAQSVKQANVTPPKQASLVQAAKQASLIAQKQANVIAQLTKQNLANKTNVVSPKQVNVLKQTVQSPKQTIVTKQSAVQPARQAPTPRHTVPVTVVKQEPPKIAQVVKTMPPVVAPPHKSPLIKQRPLQKPPEAQQVSNPSASVLNQQIVHATTVLQPTTSMPVLNPNKVTVFNEPGNIRQVVQGTRSLLIRPSAIQTTVTAAAGTSTPQVAANPRRGVVRVLSPANPSAGKSLISPRALMQQGTITTKKRVITQETASATTTVQSALNASSVVSSVPSAATPSVTTRTVQLAGGRTVQLAANQTVHLPGGQAVQLTSGHTLQLSSLQLPTHSVRLPSGQTVQLASPQAVRAVSSAVKTPSPRAQQSSPTVKTSQTGPTVQIPISSVQLAGQTVQIGGQTVQWAGQSVQLTGHTVKLPSGQSVQVASQSVLPSQSVQLPSGQTVQITGQSVQLGQNVLSNQSVQGGQSLQTVQLGGQTVQLAGGQTVQLPNGQTLQLASGQTVQLSSGQTLQLAGGQVQLGGQQSQKPLAQVVRSQATVEKTAQPIVAKLLANAQGGMMSLEGGLSPARALHMSGVRVLAPARAPRPPRPPRAPHPPRPLLLAAGKPLHNIILQQSDGTAIRVTSSGGATTSQTIVLSNIGAQTVTTSTNSAPVLKLQQVNSLQQVKLSQGIKIQQAGTGATVPTSSVRSVLMDGQQLKLVGGRHVLARILRPAHPPPPQ